jgi:hypothetical protein
MATSAPKLVTKAWLLMGLTGSAPGVLRLADGRLSLGVQGSGVLWGRQLRALERRVRQPGLAGRLSRGEAAEVFNTPLDRIRRVVFPWYYFGGGAIIETDHARFRLSFLQPQNTTTVSGPLFGPIGGIAEGRRAGKAWKAALGHLK